MEQQGISKLDLKRQNRMQILKLLKQQGPTSRIDIAGILELTRAAVTIITNEMIDQGIISEIGEQKSMSERAPRGRKKILIDINHNYKFALGVLIDDDQISVGLSTLAGDVLDKRNITFDESANYSTVIDFIKTSVGEIMSHNCLDESHILGIGVGVLPSTYSRINVWSDGDKPDYSSLEMDIRGFSELPIIFENSVKAVAMANLDFQKVKVTKPQNVAFFQYGENFGNVILTENEPIKSRNEKTNIIEGLRVAPGENGTLKEQIAPAAIIARVQEQFSATQTPHLYEATNGDASRITLALIKEASDSGDEGVTTVLESVLRSMCVLVNNLACVANPERIILHGFNQNTKFLLDLLLQRGAEYMGKDTADLLMQSNIDVRVRFLGGCSVVIRELFFKRGGFDMNYVPTEIEF